MAARRNTTGQIIEKPAGPDDAYTGGQQILRDGSQLSGGTPGHVNTASFVRTITGKFQRSFEWAHLAILDNYSDEGENVASYRQANKHGTGPTWGGCDEAVDISGKPGALRGREVDIFVAGPASDDRPRIGVDIVAGDGRIGRGIPTDRVAEGLYGGRVGALSDQPWVRWLFGWIIQRFSEAGIVLDSDPGGATRGIWVRGQYIVGLDFADAKVNTVIRLAPGQRIAFAPYDQIGFGVQGNTLVVDNGGRAMFSLNTDTGDLHIAGKLTQGAL